MLTRSATLTDVAADGRTITATAMRWNETAVVNDGAGPYRERFARGSIRPRHPRLPLLRAHDHQHVVGTVVSMVDDGDGFTIVARLADTASGREARELVADGALSSISIGFRDGAHSEAVDGTIIRQSVELVEISLVAVSAYKGSAVTSLRHHDAQEGADMNEQTESITDDLPEYTPEEAAHRRELAAQCAVRGENDRGASSPQLPDSPAGTSFQRDPLGTLGRDQRDWRRDPWQAVREHGHLCGDARGRAMSVLELDDTLPVAAREATHAVLERGGVGSAAAALTYLRASDPLYVSGWSKLAAGQPELLDPSERQALADAADHVRAMTAGTDSTGGYLVPQAISPTLTHSTAYDVSAQAFRNISRVEMAADLRDYRFVVSDEATASWDAEGVEASDDTSTLSEVNVPLNRLTGYIPGSLEAFRSAPNLTQLIVELISSSMSSKEASAFAIGTGASNQPTGIEVALDAVAGSEVATDSAATVDLEDVRELLRVELPAIHQIGATWLMHPSYHGHVVGLLETAGLAAVQLYHGSTVVAGTGIESQALHGRPVVLSSAMDAAADGSPDTGDNAVIVGDFSNYGIVDAPGIVTEIVPTVVGGNGRPTGQRGIAVFRWTGSDVLNADAFRLLQVA
ncbi:MAG: phage major capsid protein [Acidimicrobiia bacterium]|nr:phage major capsid protein [Acidimicrobiia bacterium]